MYINYAIGKTLGMMFIQLRVNDFLIKTFVQTGNCKQSNMPIHDIPPVENGEKWFIFKFNQIWDFYDSVRP